LRIVQVNVAQLLLGDGRGGVHEQVAAILRHGEGDDFADVRFVGQEHDDAVDAGGDSAVGRRAVAEGVDHPGEFGVDDAPWVPGEGEGLVHDLGDVVPDRAGGDFVAVADEVVLVGEDRERVLLFERFEPALRHGKRVVRELDLLGLLVHFVHRVIDDPGEFEDVLLDEVELLGDFFAHRAEDFGGLGFVGSAEKKMTFFVG
jgi:hypothetical protein